MANVIRRGRRAEFTQEHPLVVASVSHPDRPEMKVLCPCDVKFTLGDRMTVIESRLNNNTYLVDLDGCKKHLHVTMAVHIRQLDDLEMLAESVTVLSVETSSLTDEVLLAR